MDRVSCNLKHRLDHFVLRLACQAGQTTAEYALVLLAAAAVAIVLIKWATENEALTGFFDSVVDQLVDMAGGGEG